MRFKFGSFNLRNLSKNCITSRDFDTIAEIIRSEEFDVVAFQEILSEGYALKRLVNNLLPGWDIRWGEPKESSDLSKVKDNRGEGFAYAWNTRRLALASSTTDSGMRVYDPRMVSDALRYDSRMFARIPYYARFVPVNGGFFEFRLINVHLHFGDNSQEEVQKRKDEYDFLIDRVYPSISMERRYGNNREAYTIVMGDYNLNLLVPCEIRESQVKKGTYIEPKRVSDRQTIVTVQDQLTTLKAKYDAENSAIDENGYSQNYDHFSFDVRVLDAEGIKYSYRRIDAVRDYCGGDFDRYRSEISDHVPILLELAMNE